MLSIVYSLKKTVYYYLWEMALIVGLDASFDNMQDWKGREMKAGEVNQY
jgi:hypothetical protein